MIRHMLLSLVLLVCLIAGAWPGQASDCENDWVSPDPEQVYSISRSWRHSLPLSCEVGCVRITVTLQVLNYNDVGTLDLFCSNTSTFDYGNPFSATSKPGWIGRIKVSPTFVQPGWQTVGWMRSIDLRTVAGMECPRAGDAR